MEGGDLSACDFSRMQEVLSILHQLFGTGRARHLVRFWRSASS